MAQLFPFTDPALAETDPPSRFVRGEGIRVTDADGKSCIDAVSALWCSSLGFTPERLTQALTRQMSQLAYYHSFMGRTPAVADELAARLVARLPGMARVFFGTSGSEAVETAAKFARFYWNAKGRTDKKRIIAREGAYHGSGQMSAALTGLAYCHDGFDLPLDAVLRTGRPHYLQDAEPGESEIAFSRRRARELDALIRAADPGTIGAFIGEPAMGAGGVILPPEGYWSEIQEVLARHDILLIADEIICGFGRTGEWFGCETYGIRPDMMTLAKQLTASVFPMSAVAMTGEVYETIRSLGHEYGTFGHGVTYGGHPAGAAVALECLDIYEEMDLPAHTQRLGARIAAGLERLRGAPSVRDVRCQGMLAAVEMDTEGLARAAGQEAERRGVFFRIIGPVLAIAPPYICTGEEIGEIMAVMQAAVQSVTAPA
ncbi:aminotransferase class III-fold pyridoxal phosphate-dependent enzyme [Leisingera sp. D0M16]|uniref:aminotransferase class III-fold pyridoxal phosphate-dependent enzyme n=1 Tax=Leisingera coralii TaxID=3351347 RepID=UPI003B80A8DE